jgi:hypothetical protein
MSVIWYINIQATSSCKTRSHVDVQVRSYVVRGVYTHTHTHIYIYIYIYVGPAHNRPQGPKGVPGRSRSRIFLTFGTMRVVGRQPHAPAAFTPRVNPWYLFLEVESTPGHMVQSVATEKIPSVTPPGIDPETVRLVAQYLKHYATPGPICIYIYIYMCVCVCVCVCVFPVIIIHFFVLPLAYCCAFYLSSNSLLFKVAFKEMLRE